MILIIDDDLAVRTSLTLLLKKEGFPVTSASCPEDGFSVFGSEDIGLVLLDMNFSAKTSGEEGIDTIKKLKQLRTDVPIILMTGWSSIKLAVKGMKSGAFDFIQKPWDNDHLLNSVRTALKLTEINSDAINLSFTRKQIDEKYDFRNIIGDSQQLVGVLKTVGRVSATDANVLVLGESGTGKELIAEAIHANSARKHKPFIKVNLGGISSSLFESEMFGHKRGSFTDAKADRKGRFELANGGTIFLDEIGELDISSQVKLLRVLQDRTYEVLGESVPKKANVRIICATNRDLAQRVAEGLFREDLYYRINLIELYLPSLRDRSSDIPILCNYFLANLKKLYKRPDLRIDPRAFEWIKKQPLPGNIRELQNIVERTVLVTENNILEINDFKKNMDYDQNIKKNGIDFLSIELMESEMIKTAMLKYHNNVSRAAKSLGLSRGTLYRRLEKYNILHETEN